ncbi:alkaline shock response membrane anchor protein AmaP [Phosphitispora fastidiosa]|uniref:alkaline shock response membrane anchor protein AmaP n=1 Tax=Phosphitispora fastidiosa TaxID=2837202 RepID=UPI001E63E3E4|nr:alkaline shock response membrane anchor protein AmaP [Phosphitispora fastidiosa]MBU7007637.1 putative alkaline shock family protein YloU [Phosphitispora fastidiosa]
MKFFDRVLLSLYALGIMFILLLAGLAAAGWTTPVDWLRVALLHMNNRLVLGVTAMVYFIVSVRFLFLALSSAKRPAQAVVQETGMGQVRVSVDALENMVRRVTAQIKGVRDVKPRVACLPEGVSVFLHVSMAPETNIPGTSDEIQQKVAAYIEEIAGIKVQAVKILVKSVSATDDSQGSRRLI